MPDVKISELPDGGQPTDPDEGPIARGVGNFKIIWSNVRIWMEARFAPLSHVTDTSNPHVVTAAQAGADPAGSASSAVATHDANLASHDGVNALVDDGQLVTRVSGAYAPLNIGLNGQLATARPLATDKIVWEDPPVRLGFVAYVFSSNINTGQDPGAGNVRVNNALWASVTQTALDDLDATGLTLRGVLLGFQVGDVILFRQDSAPSKTAAYTLSGPPVGQTGYVQFDLTFLSEGSGGIADDAAAISIWHEQAAAGVSTFTALTDTPPDYTGAGGKLVAVNVATDGLEYIDPPAGTGDVTSTLATVNNEVQAGASTTKGIKGAGFNSADVALITGANTFAGDQTISTPGPSVMLVTSTILSANLDLLPANGAPDSQRFGVRASGGNLFIEPQNDGGLPVNDPLLLSHAGAATLGTPAGGMPGTVGVLNVEQYLQNGQALILDTLSADGELLSNDGVQYTKIGLGADGFILTSRPGGAVGDKLVWEAGLSPGTPFVIGDIMAVETASSAESVGFAAADIARLSQANTFVESQSIVTGTGNASIEVSAAITSHVNWTPRTGPVNARAFSLSAVNGTITLQARQDDLSSPVSVIQFSHEGGAELGNPAGAIPSTGILNAEGLRVEDVPVAVAASDIPDDEVALGAAGTRALKPSSIAVTDLVRRDATATIAEVGYPFTSTAQASGGTFAPTAIGNGKFHLTGVTATTIDPSALGDESQITIYVPSAVAITISPAPDIIKGTDSGTGIRLLMLERFDVPTPTVIATWN